MKRRITMVNGFEYIRKAPVKNPDGTLNYAYTDNYMVFDGYNSEGKLIMHFAKGTYLADKLGSKPFALPIQYLDKNWISGNSVKNGLKTSLNVYKGRMIQRICPAGKSYKYMYNSVRLVAATKYHVVVCEEDGQECILDCRFSKPCDWKVIK